MLPDDPRWRLRCDPLASATITDLYAEHSLAAANRVLAQVVLNDQPDPEGLPATVRHYLTLSARRPEWADPEQIRAAQELFTERGPLILLALVTASLAECYALGHGAQVLALTRRMDERHIYRRVYETAQFIVDICSPGGLEPNGRGLRAIQKVRLMHAGVRHLILAPTPSGTASETRNFVDVLLRTQWDVERLGLPINWQDQSFTLQSFAWVILRSLERFGCSCNEAESTAWLHLWAVVGHHLGIPDELCPRTVAAADELYRRIRTSQEQATPQGRELTRALGVFIAEKLDSPVIGRALSRTLLRWLCDDDTCRIVGIRPLNELERALIRSGRWLVRLVWRDPRDVLHERLGLWLVTRLTKLPREWERGLFSIPTDLSAAWRSRSP